MAPAVLEIKDEPHRTHLLTFLKEMRELVKRGTRVRLDFSRTEKTFPAGTILLLAELHRIARTVGPGFVRAREYPQSLVVEQVFQQVGIAKLLGLKHRQPLSVLPDNVRHWRSVTGASTLGAKVAPLLALFEKRIPGKVRRSLYEGLVEAMQNSFAHAYIAPRGDGIEDSTMGKRWWMFWQERDNLLTVAFCDLGIGIPRSLDGPNSWPRELIDRLVAAVDISKPVSARIKAALALGKSRTGHSYQGKGLDDILDVVRSAGQGGLMIASDRGIYLYDAAGKKEVMHDFGDSVMGTIVQWTLPLPKADDE